LMLYDGSRLIVKRRVQEIIEKLHSMDLVHGDIRQANIMVDNSTPNSPEEVSIHFIDFDWAEKVGTAKYPMNINTKSIQRPSGVIGGAPITKVLDQEMIDSLFSADSGKTCAM